MQLRIVRLNTWHVVSVGNKKMSVYCEREQCATWTKDGGKKAQRLVTDWHMTTR
jgi:hypothetical protein